MAKPQMDAEALYEAIAAELASRSGIPDIRTDFDKEVCADIKKSLHAILRRGVALSPMVRNAALMEKLAAIEHERWADWHNYAVAHWTEENLARWARQAKTPYAELSEAEKEKDREQVRRYWDLIKWG